jgi:hypothetical protein|tara:strand:+ start:135 stop:329 length:195 start_codon:yes stop_codon:yes gene_type:complete
MTIVEMANLVGRKALIRMGGKNTLEIEVSIVDVRQSWGDTQVKLEPIAGNGFAWMALSSVRMEG